MRKPVASIPDSEILAVNKHDYTNALLSLDADVLFCHNCLQPSNQLDGLGLFDWLGDFFCNIDCRLAHDVWNCPVSATVWNGIENVPCSQDNLCQRCEFELNEGDHIRCFT